MWDNEDQKSIRLKNILLILGVVLLVAVFLIVYIHVSRKNTAEDEQLHEIYEQQKTTQAEEKNSGLLYIQQEYDKDMETVETYMPGIVCWGDRLTAGSEGNKSFTSTLQSLINSNICALYNFSGTIENAEDYYTKVDFFSYKVKIPVVNMGGGTENVDTVMGRQGSANYIVSKDVTIPSSCEKVKIELKSPSGEKIKPVTYNNVGIETVTIGDIEGTLSLSDSSSSSNVTIYFTRSEPGEETEIEKGTEVITSGAGTYKNYIPVFWVGTYGGWKNADELVEKVKTMVDYAGSDRYIVIGIFKNTESYSESASTFASVESKMKKEFGNRFINLREYLISDAADDAGVKLTTDDTRQIKNGLVPNSLRNSSSSAELSATAYELVGNLVYERMKQLGYFDEITAELGIDEVIENQLITEINSKYDG